MKKMTRIDLDKTNFKIQARHLMEEHRTKPKTLIRMIMRERR